MTRIVRLNFAEPPGWASRLAGVFGVSDLGNTQTVNHTAGQDEAVVININPAKHCNPDGSLKPLQQLIDEERKEDGYTPPGKFEQLRDADKVELLGHGGPGSDSIYSNFTQNFSLSSLSGRTEYKLDSIGHLLSQCKKTPNIDVISCNSSSKPGNNSPSMCEQLLTSLNSHRSQGNRPAFNPEQIHGYDNPCGVGPGGKVFEDTNKKSSPLWVRCFSFIGQILFAIFKFIGALLGALFGLTSGKGPKSSAEESVASQKREGPPAVVEDHFTNTNRRMPGNRQSVGPHEHLRSERGGFVRRSAASRREAEQHEIEMQDQGKPPGRLASPRNTHSEQVAKACRVPLVKPPEVTPKVKPHNQPSQLG